MKIFKPKVFQKDDFCPFEKHYRSDSWVLYHGTSNLSEKRIERDGFCCEEPPFSLEEITRVVKIYKELGWGGLADGYSIIGSFARHSFEQLRSKTNTTTSFSPSSRHACGYAGPNRAGGETATGMRNALDHLRSFLSTKSLQQDHLWYLCSQPMRFVQLEGLSIQTSLKRGDVTYQEYQALYTRCQDTLLKRANSLGNPNYKMPVPLFEDPAGEWLRRAITACDDLKKKADALAAGYRHGCVYAVQFYESDAEWMGDNPGGPWLGKTVPPDRILAKAILKRTLYDNVGFDFFSKRG